MRFVPSFHPLRLHLFGRVGEVAPAETPAEIVIAHLLRGQPELRAHIVFLTTMVLVSMSVFACFFFRGYHSIWKVQEPPARKADLASIRASDGLIADSRITRSAKRGTVVELLRRTRREWITK